MSAAGPPQGANSAPLGGSAAATAASVAGPMSTAGPGIGLILQRYLNRLPLPGERRAALFDDALAHARTIAEALGRVHAALGASSANAANAAYATIGARLRIAIGSQAAHAGNVVARDIHGRQRL
jgi:hypothetical protein